MPKLRKGASRRAAVEAPSDPAALLGVLAMLWPHVRPFVRPLIRVIAEEYADLKAGAPLDADMDQRSAETLRELRISPRMYLQGARAREFRSTRRGRLIVARRRDVEAWLERRAMKPIERRAEVAKEESPPMSLDDQVRIELGLQPKGPLRVLTGGGKRR